MTGRLAARARSFCYAARGIAAMVASEPNARIHALATIAVVAAGVALGIDRGDWIAIALAIALVWTAEAINTAFEALCDVASPARDPRVARAKDVAAGAVLLSALVAASVGVLVFAPRLAALAAAFAASR